MLTMAADACDESRLRIADQNFDDLLKEASENVHGQCFEQYYEESASLAEQVEVERLISTCFHVFRKEVFNADPDDIVIPYLKKEQHVHFLRKSIRRLPIGYVSLDASRAWLVYWNLNALTLLNEPIDDELAVDLLAFLESCQHESGGFGGGPGQYPHLAPTYAAVNALAILSASYPHAMSLIKRADLLSFLMRAKRPDGSFIMQDGGEADIRGVYCAATVAKLTKLDMQVLFDKSPEWLASCQTYEGGFSGVPGMEAHGGYTFCGLAALVILGHTVLCDLKALLRWLTQKQMRFEGGFQGRTNKLVDSCYSFWQGAPFSIIHRLLKQNGQHVDPDHWLFDGRALQEYLLLCCQSASGGMADKPRRSKDVYHTCYAFSGLSVAQNMETEDGQWMQNNCISDPADALLPVHPLYNISMQAAAGVDEATSSWSVLGVPSEVKKPTL